MKKESELNCFQLCEKGQRQQEKILEKIIEKDLVVKNILKDLILTNANVYVAEKKENREKRKC